jgi:hypothetical protein
LIPGQVARNDLISAVALLVGIRQPVSVRIKRPAFLLIKLPNLSIGKRTVVDSNIVQKTLEEVVVTGE